MYMININLFMLSININKFAQRSPGRKMGCGSSKDGPGGASSGPDVTPALNVLEALVTGAGDKFQGTRIPTKKTLATTTVLDLRGLKLDVDGGQAIKDLLPALTALEILQMNDSGLGLAGVRMVAEGLAAFTPPNLTKLSLRQCFEGDLGCTAICEALIKGGAKNLQVIDFNSNGISEKGMEVFAKVINDLQPPLTDVFIADCPLGGEGVRVISEALQKTKLYILDLFNCQCDEAGAKALKDLIKTTPLTSLCLQQNAFAPPGAIALAEARGDATLWLGGWRSLMSRETALGWTWKRLE